MSRKRKNMIIQNEILRLKSLGHSQRKIATILGIDRGTVRRYFNGENPEPEVQIPCWVKALEWDEINKDINSKVPKKIIYEELSEANELPSYQAFCKYIKNNKNENPKDKVSLRVIRTPGESMEVDYSGDTIDILNPSTGEIYSAELFVGSLSYSGYFYAEFSLTQKQEDFINSHNRMFSFFGGVAKFIIPDNCKTAVTTPDKYDPIVNKTYHDMCIHYQITVDPADGYSPKHKPNVEKAVHVIQQDFFPRVRKKTYTSLVELNRDLRKWLEIKNNSIMKDRGNSRAYFFEKERGLLRALPTSQYQIFNFKKAKVHPDCHFQHKRNFYSVPYRFVGKEIDLKFNNKTIHAFFNTERIASHTTLLGHAHYSTVDQHYPEDKVVEINLHLSKARATSKRIGSNMERLVERLIKQDRFPLKTLRKVQGVINLREKFTNEALDFGAELCLEFNKLTYVSLKSFAKHYRLKNDEKDIAPKRSVQLTCLQGGANE